MPAYPPQSPRQLLATLNPTIRQMRSTPENCRRESRKIGNSENWIFLSAQRAVNGFQADFSEDER